MNFSLISNQNWLFVFYLYFYSNHYFKDSDITASSVCQCLRVESIKVATKAKITD